MIDFFSAGTPNGYTVAIALEETGLPYACITSVFRTVTSTRTVTGR